MDIVSIVVPTLNRPAPLQRAVASALAQTLPADLEVEVLVVDNSADGNARDAVTAFGAATRYVPAPRPGVANARNAGVAAARGRWVAFLDDDQEASPGWIAAHVATVRATGADATFGPVEARAEGGREIGAFEAYFSRAIDRPDRADATDLSAYLGTNNSMFDKTRCLAADPPFDVTLNESGGEDSLLLRRLILDGRRFAFAAEAGVLEWAPERRLTWAYVRKRKFLSGQVRVFVLHMLTPVRWSQIALWMAVGAGQFLAAGAGGLALLPFDSARGERLMATACGGLGKVLWGRRFRPALYGSGLVS